MKAWIGAALAAAFVAISAGDEAQAADTPATIDQGPTAAQIEKGFPAQAMAEMTPGGASLLCRVGVDDKAKCEVIEETPAGKGFGDAAVALIEKHGRFTAEKIDGKRVEQVIGPLNVLFSLKGLPDPTLTSLSLARQPSAAQIDAAYPPKLKERKVDAAARLTCNADETGSLEKCFVVSEFPVKAGVGEAVLSLAPLYAVKPPTKNGKPTRSQVSFPVGFGNAPAMAGRGGMPPGRGGGARGGGPPGMPKMIPTASWDKAPSWAELVAANPGKAAGVAAMRCKIKDDGRLEECAGANPQGDKALQNAAVKLAGKFEAANDPTYRKQIAGGVTIINVNFPDPAKADAPRRIAKPEWTRIADPKIVQSVFPAQATQAGLKTGRGVLDCVVAAGGLMDQCKVISEDPAGMGFGAAALSISKAMAINAWLAGEPAEGAIVRLPIRVAMPEEAPAK